MFCFFIARVVNYESECRNFTGNRSSVTGAAIFRTSHRRVCTPFRKIRCHRSVIWCHVLCFRVYDHGDVGLRRHDEWPLRRDRPVLDFTYVWKVIPATPFLTSLECRMRWCMIFECCRGRCGDQMSYQWCGACWGQRTLQGMHRRAIALAFDHIRRSDRGTACHIHFVSILGRIGSSEYRSRWYVIIKVSRGYWPDNVKVVGRYLPIQFFWRNSSCIRHFDRYLQRAKLFSTANQ